MVKETLNPWPIRPLTMTVVEAGRRLGLSEASAHRAARRGDIKTILVNGRRHVPIAWLEAKFGESSE